MTEPVYRSPPSNWRSSRIKQVAALSPGLSENAPSPSEECVYVPMERLGTLGDLDVSQSIQFEDSPSGLTVFEAGDVLFAKITPCMENGKGALVPPLPHRFALGSSEYHVLRPFIFVDPNFLYQLTANYTFRRFAEANMTGAAGQKRVTGRFIRESRIYLPDKPEQVRIGMLLRHSCIAIDRAVERKREQVRVLQLAWRAELQRAVTRGLSDRPVLRATRDPWLAEVPVSWGLRALKRASTTQGGLTLGKTYDGLVIERPYLRVANVQDGFLDLEDVTTIEIPASAAARVELRRNDVLMNEGGDLDKLGRGCLWNGEIPGCLHQNHVFAVRCFPHILDPAFLTHVTASAYGRAYFEATGKRTTNLAATNSTKVGLFPVPMPPLPEQQRIAAFLNERNSEFARLRGNLQRQVGALTAYRKSLIHECVTGIRRVTQEDLNRVLHHAVLPS